MHGWSQTRRLLKASPYQAPKLSFLHKQGLYFTPIRIWKFPDAHFTQKNTKAVNINLASKESDMKITCNIKFYGCLNSLLLRKLSQNKYFLPGYTDEKSCWVKFAVSSRACLLVLTEGYVFHGKTNKQKQSRLGRKNVIQPHKNNRLMVLRLKLTDGSGGWGCLYFP